MNRTVINHGSIEELRALEARKGLPHGPGIASMPGGLKRFNEIAEEYDPGGKRAHELAAKYYEPTQADQQQEEENDRK